MKERQDEMVKVLDQQIWCDLRGGVTLSTGSK